MGRAAMAVAAAAMACVLVSACSAAPQDAPPAGRQPRILRIIKAGNGNGSTTPVSDWFPGSFLQYQDGQTVTLKAVPGPHARFAGWSGDVDGAVDAGGGALAVPMDRDREIKAAFERDLVTLDFRAAPPDALKTSPRPVRHLFRKGDRVVLRADPPPGRPLRWEGPATVLNGTMAVVQMDGDRTVTAGLGDGGNAGAGEDFNGFDVAASDGTTLNSPLAAGNLSGWFAAPLLEGPPWGAGLSWLSHASRPDTCPFRWLAMNYEHVLNGAAADRGRFSDTPRRDPMRILPRPPAAVEARWSADSSAWPLDCAAVYTLSGENAVDLVFDVTPRKNCFPKGYLVLMFASYLNFARDGVIHFPGIDKGGEGWTSLGAPGPDGKPECGNVPMAGAPLLGFDPEVVELNMRDHPDKRFTRPFYYGLTDGDADYATTDDDMVVIMMFEPADQVRFALWNWTGNPRNPAWDWHFVPRNPEAGKTERFRARMVFKPFAGRDDVEAEYARWRGSLAAGL